MTNVENIELFKGKRILPFLGRFVLSIVLLVILLWIPAVALQPWHSQWGVTNQEANMPLPGDELIAKAAHQATLGVTVTASPEKTWPWLAQLGADRGGLYSYSWLERLMFCPIHNADQIIPSFQNPGVGDPVRLCPGDFGPPPGTIAAIQPNRAFIFGGRDNVKAAWDSTWQFVLVPQDANHTRLLLRLRSANYSLFSAVMEPAFFLMERRMLQGIQERAEGQFRAEWLRELEMILWIAAFVGFLIAGGMLVFRRDSYIPTALTALTAGLTLSLAFAQPPLWIDLLSVILIYIGLGWFVLSQRSHISLALHRQKLQHS